MKHVSLLSLLLVCLCCGQAKAQCGNELVEKAASQSGANAVYLREFKVKFDGSERGKAIPTAKYPILLSKHTTYRFNVCSAEEFEGKVILQLYLKDKLMGSTFDAPTSSDVQHFDFTCDKTATYEVVMSFNEGKPGCAVGILSLIPEKQADAAPADKELDVIYASADNPIMIFDDEDEFARIEVSIDNGSVVKVEGANYIIHPDEAGTALLTLRVLHRDGSLKEFKQKKFAVLELNKPYASIRGMVAGQISKEELMQSGRLDLWFSEGMKCNYQVLSFTLSDRNDLISGISTTSGRFSKAQRDWINGLPTGTRLFIKNIQVRTTDHVVMNIGSQEFEIR